MLSHIGHAFVLLFVGSPFVLLGALVALCGVLAFFIVGPWPLGFLISGVSVGLLVFIFRWALDKTARIEILKIEDPDTYGDWRYAAYQYFDLPPSAKTWVLWVVATVFYLLLAGILLIVSLEPSQQSFPYKGEVNPLFLFAGATFALAAARATAVLLVRRRIRAERPAATFRNLYRTELVSV